MNIDEALACGRRSLRTMPNTCLLGPTGARLWADVLHIAPGFSGAIDFIHKLNIPLLFTVGTGEDILFEPCDIRWYPSHLTLRYDGPGLEFEERKFISWDDCAVSCQTWINRGKDKRILRLATDPRLFQNDHGSGFGQYRFGVFDARPYGFRIASVVMTSDPRLFTGLELQSGERVDVVISASLGVDGTDDFSGLCERAKRYISMTPGEIISVQRREYGSWFERAPVFLCNEPLLNKTWSYRWFLLRHNLAHPRLGNLRFPCFYEGRSHKMSKTPFAPEGWEFSKMIPLTAPMHILEARWHHDAEIADGILRNMTAGQDEDGLYRCLYVDRTLHSYANFMGWAAYQLYLVRGDRKIVRECLASLKKQVDGERRKYGGANDELLVEYVHQHTGKEYQPSYWFFHNFPLDCKDPARYTPVKRVDRSVYHYLNCLGVAGLCHALGDPDAERYKRLAETVKTHILQKMWDDSDPFFYDLHYRTDEKAMVKNIVGFYPYWAELTDERHVPGLLRLFEDTLFSTPCPFPSVAADCPVYAPEGGWRGMFIKGRNGCVWNGPSWPYTNSIVLDALARQSKKRHHVYDKRFGRYLRQYALMHFAQRDLNRPYLVEHYNSQTGEAISDEADYLHSYFIDLIIRHVAGLDIVGDHIVLDPVDIGLEWFSLGPLHVRGRCIEISFNRDGAGNPALPPGYRLTIDGRATLASERMERMECSL